MLSLGGLGKEERKLCDKINAKMPTESGVLPVDGGVTLCEDKDDWIVITLKERKELDEVTNKIKRELNKALDLGLGFLRLIQNQCKNYEIKV